MATTMQCPKCELLFVTKTMLDQHCQDDHPDFRHAYRAGPATTSAGVGGATRDWPGLASTRHRSSGPKRVLVVANQTLGGEALVDRIRARATEGPCAFSLVVPASSPPADGFAGGTGARGSDDAVPGDAAPDPVVGHRPDPGRAAELAARQLAVGLGRLHDVGVTADGAVGDRDPFVAVRAALAAGAFDEVIVSVLPSGVSHWWRQQLPGRVQRLSGLPVTVVAAAGPEEHR